MALIPPTGGDVRPTTPSPWRRFVDALTHSHDFQPVLEDHISSAHGERYRVRVSRCACGAEHVETTRAERRAAWRVRGVAVVLAGVTVATAARASEVKRCDLAPFDVPPLVAHTPTPLTGALLPRLADGTAVPWATPGAALVVVVAGMSNVANMSGAIQARLKTHFGTAAGQGKQVRVVSVAQQSMETRAWADPTSEAWTKAAQKLAAAGVTAAQVSVWLQVQTVMDWTAKGLMTADEVAATMANAQAVYPNVALFSLADLTPMQWAHAETSSGAPLAGGVSVDGIPYPDGMLTRHPSPIEIAHDGAVLAAIAETQAGVPAGTRAEYHQLAALPVLCGLHYKADGVHYTGSGAGGGDMFVGGYSADQVYAWLRPLVAWAR